MSAFIAGMVRSHVGHVNVVSFIVYFISLFFLFLWLLLQETNLKDVVLLPVFASVVHNIIYSLRPSGGGGGGGGMGNVHKTREEMDTFPVPLSIIRTRKRHLV